MYVRCFSLFLNFSIFFRFVSWFPPTVNEIVQTKKINLKQVSFSICHWVIQHVQRQNDREIRTTRIMARTTIENQKKQRELGKEKVSFTHTQTHIRRTTMLAYQLSDWNSSGLHARMPLDFYHLRIFHKLFHRLSSHRRRLFCLYLICIYSF